jgi:hypothetical protein
MSCQLHGPATLTSGKSFQYLLDRMLGGQEKPLAPARNRTQPSSCRYAAAATMPLVVVVVVVVAAAAELAVGNNKIPKKFKFYLLWN